MENRPVDRPDPTHPSLGYPARLEVTGEGPPLVLVPGMDGTGRLFHRQVPRLARRRRVATYALRDGARSMAELVADLRRIVDAVAPGDGRAVIVGESFGGGVALSFALAHPERTAALVVLNSFPWFGPQVRLRLAVLGVRLFPWNVMPIVRRITVFRMHSSHTGPEEIQRFLDVTRETTREGYLNRLRILRRYDVRDRLREIHVPTLFLAASEDHLVPSVEQAERMAAAVPGARLRVLEGHGHVCLIAPDVDLGEILDEALPQPDTDRA
ncbi:MAG TPA: alpha/beta hydrolase [Gemmatimonadota bacterium]|nr:alpha/beta hydrolase [Gemmatimonadota bacterium]